ncbi:MAG: hypothetical protein SNJ79_11640 [Sphingomonadaceae bacterium]
MPDPDWVRGPWEDEYSLAVERAEDNLPTADPIVGLLHALRWFALRLNADATAEALRIEIGEAAHAVVAEQCGEDLEPDDIRRLAEGFVDRLPPIGDLFEALTEIADAVRDLPYLFTRPPGVGPAAEAEWRERRQKFVADMDRLIKHLLDWELGN